MSPPATPADIPAAGPPFPEPVVDMVVYDYAQIFTPQTEATASATIAAIEERVGGEIVVYSQLKPGSTTASTEADARALIDQWGVGQAGVNDGLAIFFNMQRGTCDPGAGGNGQVQLFAAPGFSAKYLSDAQRQQIFDEEVLPLLRECQLDAGLLIALDRLDSATTAEPVDVAQEFVRQLAAAQGIEADISGQATIAGVVLEFSGEFGANALGDQQTRLAATLPDGTETVSEEIRVSGKGYARSDDGPWLPEQGAPGDGPASPEPSDDQSGGLTSALDSIVSVTDQGTVTRDGRTIHRLVAPPGVVIDPATLGIDPSLSDVSAGLEFFAEPDGTPAIMVLSADWQGTTGHDDLPGSMTLEFTFRDFGQHVEIEAPTDAWEWQAIDELGLTYAQPPGWFVEPDSGGFSITSPIGNSIWLFRARGWRGADLRRTSAEDVRLLREAWAEEGYNLALESTYEVDIGGHLALVADLTDAARGVSVQSGVLIRGDRLYVLQYVAWGDTRNAARTFVEHFAGTVAFE